MAKAKTTASEKAAKNTTAKASKKATNQAETPGFATEEIDGIDNLNPREYIIIKGARVHNLKNLSVALPRNKFIVVTGLSGSGKSSLAFDTLYAEGQRM